MDILSVKAFRNLVSGEDDELRTAYAHFHKMVEQEQGVIRNATLAALEQLRKETDQKNKILVASTERVNRHLESMIALCFYPVLAPNAIHRSRRNS